MSSKPVCQEHLFKFVSQVLRLHLEHLREREREERSERELATCMHFKRNYQNCPAS